MLWGTGKENDEENPMQDLFENYVDDLNKLRDAFHDELTATAEELSKAMGNYSQRSEAALASFMEKVSARGVELEAAAAARLNQFRGLPETAVCRTSVTDRARIPQQMRIKRKSQPLQSGRSRTVCMSRAMGIASRSWAAR